MQFSKLSRLGATFVMFGAAQGAAAGEVERASIAEKYRWNLADLYPSDAAWEKAQQELVDAIPSLEQCRGKVTESAEQLLSCLDRVHSLWKDAGRLNAYASMSSDQDTRVASYQAMAQQIRQVGVKLQSAASFVEPEVLAVEKARIEGFLKEEKGLGIYTHYLEDVLRRKDHTGTEREEEIISNAGLMAGASWDTYRLFTNADFPNPTIELADGTQVELDDPAFSLHRQSRVRADREKVFSAFFGKLGEFQRTLGATLSGTVKSHVFAQKARRYDSCLESALYPDAIPTDVYKNLIASVRESLPTFHRYLKLRKRMLGVEQLHYYDLYAPLVEGVDLEYSVEQAQELVLASLAPLGEEYAAVVARSFEERWLDFYPSAGKESGAYSNGGAYDVHPYMLLNYNGRYDDVSTLTHELGHTMQSHLSNEKQPFPTANYPTFVAEVASIFNEALLSEHMQRTITDSDVRLSLLGSYLEGIKGSVFRQTQFAEFELRIHELAEKGEPLTGDVFNELYREIARAYYGHDEGVCIVDPEIEHEWAFIPHFYFDFYVFQYATSATAAAALAAGVLAGDEAALARYLEFLSAGGSEYPIELLKKAGVDMTTAEPFELTMQRMNLVMDEMEKLLDAKQP